MKADFSRRKVNFSSEKVPFITFLLGFGYTKFKQEVQLIMEIAKIDGFWGGGEKMILKK